MSKWTHAICEKCWDKNNSERKPIKIKDGGEETCCFCGGLNTDGIFIRADGDKLLCEGKCAI
jgi:hypothetical protein